MFAETGQRQRAGVIQPIRFHTARRDKVKTNTNRAFQCSAVVLAGLMVTTACSSSGGGESAQQKNPSFKGRGPITYVAGKDAGGSVQPVIDRWNKKHPKEKVTFVELPT
ncbi:MAG: hypothetical protein ACRDP3_16735, partial [Streptomyces sp.]